MKKIARGEKSLSIEKKNKKLGKRSRNLSSYKEKEGGATPPTVHLNQRRADTGGMTEKVGMIARMLTAREKISSLKSIDNIKEKKKNIETVKKIEKKTGTEMKKKKTKIEIETEIKVKKK